MKKLFLVLSLLIYSLVFGGDISKEMKSQNKQIVKLALDAIGKKLPQKVDNFTQLVGISSKDLNLIYTFEIFTGAKSDEFVAKDGKKRMEKNVKNGICQSSKRFLQADIDISYIYISKISKKVLFRFDVTKSDCIY